MENQIQKTENTLQSVNEAELSSYLDLFGFKDIPQLEKEQFVKVCMLNNLNPFKREAYISAYGEGKYRKFAIITGYEVYIKRAEASGRLDGWNVKIEGCKSVKLHANGATQIVEDVKAVLTIYRKDFAHQFIHEVKLSEYVGKKRDGTPTSFWLNMPETMIKKVVISQGFRLCFNEIIGGMPYTKEEMSDFEIMPEVETKKEAPKAVKKPILDIDSDAFSKAVAWLADPRNNIDEIEAKYKIDEETRVELVKGAMDIFVENQAKNSETEETKQ